MQFLFIQGQFLSYNIDYRKLYPGTLPGPIEDYIHVQFLVLWKVISMTNSWFTRTQYYLWVVLRPLEGNIHRQFLVLQKVISINNSWSYRRVISRDSFWSSGKSYTQVVPGTIEGYLYPCIVPGPIENNIHGQFLVLWKVIPWIVPGPIEGYIHGQFLVL